MIRALEEKDLGFIVDIDREDEGVTKTGSTTISDEDRIAKMTKYINHPGYGGFVYEENGDNVGLIMYSMENRHEKYPWPTIYHEIDESYFSKSGDMLSIYHLWVAPTKRRRGIATLLKNEVEDLAEEKGILTIYSHTEVSNQKVIDLNQQLGYRVVRIGKIWDNVARVSMIKDLRRKSPNDMLKDVRKGHNCIIHADDLVKVKDRKDVQIIDIRHHEDFTQGHIEGAVQVHWDEVFKFCLDGKLDKHIPVVVVCYSGQSSMHVAVLLTLKGYNAYSLLDGMEYWSHVKYPML